MHGREPADINGSFSLKPAAEKQLVSLRQRQEIPVEATDTENTDSEVDESDSHDMPNENDV